MAITNPVQRLSEAEYLKIERAAELKSEFYEGEMFTTSGGTRWHSLVAANTIRALGNALAQGNCVVFDSNMRVKVEATGLYAYPDVSVACENPRFVDNEMDTLVNPTFLVEVLSESTEAYDRGKKAEHYRQILSLREYVLVSQNGPRVEQYIRQENGDWLLRDTVGIKSELKLVSLNISIPLAEVFSKVQFETAPAQTASARRE
jgi:Uma2 family endonuclease